MPRKKQPLPENDSGSQLAVAIDPREQVIAWLLEGRRESQIAEEVSRLFPDRDSRALLIEAADHFEQAAGCDLDVVVGWALEAYKELYRQSLIACDFQTAVKAIKELVALAGKHCVRESNEGETEVGK